MLPLKTFINRLAYTFFLVTLSLSNHTVLAETRSLCVFDLLGANGPVYAQMKDYKIAAMDWGVEFRLKPYISEKKAVEDFKSGVCDAVSFTGIQSRQFNSFSGSLDAMGALPSYDHLKMVISSISTKQAAPLMLIKPYEVVGVIPMGATYLFVNDRSLVTSYGEIDADLTSIRVAVMDSDPAQAEMVGSIGTISVCTSIAEMYKKFNMGLVDATYGPAVVYEAMELRKGLGSNGGVIRFPLAQLTLQIIVHHTRFLPQFGQKSREYALSQFDKSVMLAKRYEDRISQKWWINIPDNEQTRYHEIYRKTRMVLKNKGIYDGKMLKIMRLVRCKKDPKLAECIAEDKE